MIAPIDEARPSREGEELDADAFKALIRAAVALNRSRSKG